MKNYFSDDAFQKNQIDYHAYEPRITILRYPGIKPHFLQHLQYSCFLVTHSESLALCIGFFGLV